MEKNKIITIVLLTFIVSSISFVLAQDCSNNPSSSLDCSYSCDNNGVYDYTAKVCCPLRGPNYYSLNNHCYSQRVPGADNYFTRNSECSSIITPVNGVIDYENSPPQYEEKCEGSNYLMCYSSVTNDATGMSDPENFIAKWVDKGIIIGKCEIECLDGEIKGYICPNGESVGWCTCENNKLDCILSPENQCEIQECNTPIDCEGLSHIETAGAWNCINNKCVWETNPKPNYLWIIGIVAVILITLIYIVRRKK